MNSGLSELGCLTSDHLLRSTVEPAPGTVDRLEDNKEQRTGREYV